MNDTNTNFWQLPDGLHKLPCTDKTQAARLRTQVNGYNRISGGTHVAILASSPKRMGEARLMIFPHKRVPYAPWDMQSLKEGASAPEGYFIPCDDGATLQLIRSIASRVGCMVSVEVGGARVRQKPASMRIKTLRECLLGGDTPCKVPIDGIKPARTLVWKLNKEAGRKKYRVVKDGTTYWAKIVD